MKLSRRFLSSDGEPAFPDTNREPFSFEELFEYDLEEPPGAENRQVGKVERDERKGMILYTTHPVLQS